ncbi:MAG: VanZ family protein [Betaproteobacteria bacterium]|nr:VanZ family protein [Betaproteobacteria bacterium]
MAQLPAAVGTVAPRGSPLARLMFGVYAVLVVYASLYPFSGWRDPQISALAFLSAPWPRFLTVFDVAANVLGYLPLGLLCALAVYPGWRKRRALFAGAVCGALLSLLLEATQSYLPTRFASNVDLLCNIAGALLGGALGARYAPRILAEAGPLKQWRRSVFRAGLDADLGLVLIALWLFTQLNPTMLLFGAGDLRDLFAATEGRGYAPRFFVTIETLAAAANLLAVAILFADLAVSDRLVRRALVLLVLLALCVKSAAFVIVLRVEHVFAWLTPGAKQGLAIGLLAAFAALAMPRGARLVLAAILLLAATVFVNLAPPNPYLAATLTVWQQGHFLNFNGLTRLVSFAWPFAALAYLILLASRRAGQR